MTTESDIDKRLPITVTFKCGACEERVALLMRDGMDSAKAFACEACGALHKITVAPVGSFIIRASAFTYAEKEPHDDD